MNDEEYSFRMRGRLQHQPQIQVEPRWLLSQIEQTLPQMFPEERRIDVLQIGADGYGVGPHAQGKVNHARHCKNQRQQNRTEFAIAAGAWRWEAGALYRWSFPDFAVHSSSPGSECRGLVRNRRTCSPVYCILWRNPSILRVAASCRVASFPIPRRQRPSRLQASIRFSRRDGIAVNGALGIEVARTAQPTVILMDIDLPGISGVEALKILRVDPSTAHIPVVALSANAMPRDIEKGLQEACLYFSGWAAHGATGSLHCRRER